MKIALIFIAAVIALVCLYATSKPNAFRVERRLRIKAAAEKLFALVNDYRHWPEWSPYEQLDPNMTKRFSGAASGQGAVYNWEGRKAGKGSIEIRESVSPSKIVMQLDMLSPMEGHNVVEFTFAPVGDATEVTWTMHGPTRYLSKLMSVFFNMDRMVGGQFEQGLAKLKTVAEKQSA